MLLSGSSIIYVYEKAYEHHACMLDFPYEIRSIVLLEYWCIHVVHTHVVVRGLSHGHFLQSPGVPSVALP